MLIVIYMMIGIIYVVNKGVSSSGMRVTQEQMESSHRRIVEGASKLLRERGVLGTSVADAMREAGMTHGGFYRHFETKDDLVVEALLSAFDDLASPLELRQQSEAPASVAAEYRSQYLSPQHLEAPAMGCPMPTLAGELARGSPAVKAAFAQGVERVVAALANASEGSVEQRRASAMRQLSMLVGAVLIARASDPDTASAVLAACRD